MKTSDFDYSLPPDLIAQTPWEPRDHSRLMVLDRKGGSIQHRRFYDIVDYLHEGDVLVFNDTRVIPARLTARKETGARLEVLLLQRTSAGVWKTLVRPARRAPPGTRLTIAGESRAQEGPEIPITAEVLGQEEGGIRVLKINGEEMLAGVGEVPLPPYIHEPLSDPDRYQTVYGRAEGSVAAPTAGLHFTKHLIEKLRRKGVKCVFVTLHVGLDTFRPVKTEDPADHHIHTEFGTISPETAAEIAAAKAEGRRVVCVGTTSVRLVEAAAQKVAAPGAFSGWVDLFITPGYEFRVTNAMITNFHLPRTTLLMMVSAFGGRESILRAYREAADEGYRFYSFGDGMLIS